jgi:hypothetical protein
MDSKSLARAVAADLGEDVLAVVDDPPPPGEMARGFVEAVAIASFVAACAQLAIGIWQARQDRALLVLALAEGLENKPELASRLDPDRRLGLMGRVVNALVPERFGSSPSIPVVKQRTRREWLADWAGYTDATRAMTQPILVPFADMDNWIVYKPIYWTPPHPAAGLPRSITVPQGFITDLASIPQYFWWALPPSGRYGHAAILHDWLYWEQACPRVIADRAFETAMAELNVALPLRKAMWAAVRVGGSEYWAEAASQRKLGDRRVLKRIPETPVTFSEWKSNPDVFA